MKSFSRHIFTVILFALTFFALTVCASAASESEPNDDINSANSINVNELIIGFIEKDDNYYDHKDEYDYFKFTLPSDGYIKVTYSQFYYDSSSSWVTLKIFNQNKEEYKRLNIKRNAVTTETADIGLPGGTYYISISNSYSKEGFDYNLTVNYTASSDWEKEFNNSMDKSNAIKTNHTYYGCLAGDDVDVYDFSIDKNGVVNFTINHEYEDSSYTMCYAKIYTYDGTKKNEIYRYTVKLSSQTSTSLKLGLPAGKYFFETSSSSSKYERPYNFKINYTATDDWEVYPNNQLTNATNIQIGKTYNGSFYNSSEKDYYSFNLDKTATIKVTFNHTFINSESIFANVKISSYDGTVLTQLSNFEAKSNSQASESSEITLDPGKYYVIVEEYSAEGNEYNFKIDYATAATQPVEKPTNSDATRPAVNNDSTAPTENNNSVDNTYLEETRPFENNVNIEENNQNEYTKNDNRSNEDNNKNTVEIPVSALIAIVVVIVLVGAGVAIFFVIKKQKENQNA